jgi:signal transduction histidine kinase
VQADNTSNVIKKTRVPLAHSVFSRIFVPALFVTLIPAIIIMLIAIVSIRQALAPELSSGGIMVFLGNIRYHLLFVALVAIGISALFSYLLSRSITKPVSEIIAVLQKIADGDYHARVSIRRRDELGLLARFFNQAAEQFFEMQERGIALSQIKSQFVTVAAHQLRTPLSAMKWTLRLMLDGDMGELNGKQKEFLQQGYQTNEHMIRLVNDFLDISRIEEGRFGFHFKKIRIFDTLKKALDESRAQALVSQVTLDLKIALPPDLTIIADEDRVYTAMMSLIENAIRYNSKGGNVRVEALLRGDMVEVRVIDTGIGIPADEQSKVFSRFYRATNAIRRQTEGSGLGLFIVKNIIERHGGAVDIISEENKGTTVFFTLPVKENYINKS